MHLRAGIFSASHLAGGLEVRLQEEAAVLEDLGLSSSWFCPPFDGKNRLRAGFEQHRCEMVDLDLADPFRRWRFRLVRMKYLELQGRRLRRQRLDFAHVALSWTNAGLAQALACSAAGVPFVVAVHNYFPPTHLAPWTRDAAASAFRGARTIYAVSGSSLAAFNEIYADCLPAACRLEVVENGIDLDRFAGGLDREADIRHTLGVPRDGCLLVFAGRLDDKKRPQLAVEVLAALRREGVDASLVLLGEGPLRADVVGLATTLKVAERVHLPGHRPDPERYFRAADAFILPSRSEGLPLALLEASAAGALPIGYPVPGVADVIDDGINGLLLDDASATRSAAHMADLWRRPADWTRMAAAAMAGTQERFSRPLMRRRLAEVYRAAFPELLGRESSPSASQAR